MSTTDTLWYPVWIAPGRKGGGWSFGRPYDSREQAASALAAEIIARGLGLGCVVRAADGELQPVRDLLVPGEAREVCTLWDRLEAVCEELDGSGHVRWWPVWVEGGEWRWGEPVATPGEARDVIRDRDSPQDRPALGRAVGLHRPRCTGELVLAEVLESPRPVVVCRPHQLAEHNRQCTACRPQHRYWPRGKMATGGWIASARGPVAQLDRAEHSQAKVAGSSPARADRPWFRSRTEPRLRARHNVPLAARSCKRAVGALRAGRSERHGGIEAAPPSPTPSAESDPPQRGGVNYPVHHIPKPPRRPLVPVAEPAHTWAGPPTVQPEAASAIPRVPQPAGTAGRHANDTPPLAVMSQSPAVWVPELIRMMLERSSDGTPMPLSAPRLPRQGLTRS